MVEVEDSFFDDVKQFVDSEKKEYLDSLRNFSAVKARNFTNLKRVVEEIFSLREKKLLNKALICSRTGDFEETGLSSSEKETFRKLVEVINKHKTSLNSLFEAPGKKSTSGKALNKVSLRILKDIPSFVGADMKEYGPFSKNGVAELPEKVAKLLVSRKIAEKN